jgi:hypothetical protein
MPTRTDPPRIIQIPGFFTSHVLRCFAEVSLCLS